MNSHIPIYHWPTSGTNTYAPMYYVGPTGYEDPTPLLLPIVDHRQDRPQHAHRGILHYITHPHRKSPSEEVQLPLSQPDLDIRETETEYVVEVELPGLSPTDKSAIKIESTSARALTLEGRIVRSELPVPEPVPLVTNESTPEREQQQQQQVQQPPEEQEKEKGGEQMQMLSEALQNTEDLDLKPKWEELKKAEKSEAETKAGTGRRHEPELLVCERRIGPFKRYFNFPRDVEATKIKAKLENGLLVIHVPKKTPHRPTWRRVLVE